MLFSMQKFSQRVGVAKYAYLAVHEGDSIGVSSIYPHGMSLHGVEVMNFINL